MTDRHAQIVRLLETRFDHLPQPVRRCQAAAGFVHQTLAPTVCEVCEGVDSVNCTGCGGRGWVERMRDRDPYAPGVVAPYGFDGNRHEAAKERDRQIARLDEQLRPPGTEADLLEDANRRPYLWEIERRRMYAAFDYGPLDRALEALALTHPGLSPYGEQGLAFLDARLPDPLRAPCVEPEKRVRGPIPSGGQRAAATLTVRNAEMRARADAGATPAEIAAEFRVSIPTVYRAVNTDRTEAA